MAKRKVIWSKNALTDRLQILEYWYHRIGNKKYSNKLDKAIKHIVGLLVHFPNMGRKFEDKEVRFVVKEYYLIFYRVDDSTNIEILHIWDSRRNLDSLNL